MQNSLFSPTCAISYPYISCWVNNPSSTSSVTPRFKFSVTPTSKPFLTVQDTSSIPQILYDVNTIYRIILLTKYMRPAMMTEKKGGKSQNKNLAKIRQFYSKTGRGQYERTFG